MLGDDWMAFKTSNSEWTFYTTTAVNKPGYDGCGETGSHDWGQTVVEDGVPNGKCGGYYTQYAFVTEVGCILVKDDPTR
jgi:hypothetical protein